MNHLILLAILPHACQPSRPGEAGDVDDATPSDVTAPDVEADTVEVDVLKSTDISTAV